MLPAQAAAGPLQEVCRLWFASPLETPFYFQDALRESGVGRFPGHVCLPLMAWGSSLVNLLHCKRYVHIDLPYLF